MKTVSYESNYKVGEGDVQLEVIIGDGQFGSTLVMIGADELEQVHDFKRVLGKGPDLAGKIVSITSIVTDTNVQTNKTSVTYRLAGGPTPLEHTLAFTVDNERDSVDYEATFKLE